MEAPRRERVRHVCCCVLLSHDGLIEDRCPRVIDDPDSPFCDSCSWRHPELAYQHDVIVSAYLPQKL